MMFLLGITFDQSVDFNSPCAHTFCFTALGHELPKMAGKVYIFIFLILLNVRMSHKFTPIAPELVGFSLTVIT